MKRSFAVVLVLLISILTGCAVNKLVANNMSGSMADIKAAFFAEESPTHGFHAGPALLKMLDGFIRSSPENEELLLSAAELNCGFALTFLDLYDPAWAAHLYAKGQDYALRGLYQVNEELALAITSDDKEAFTRLLAELDVESELPYVFWTGMCWGGLMNALQDPVVAIDLPKVEKLLAASVKGDPKYYFGAGHTFFGMLFAGRSKMLGGDLERGREHFEKGLAVTDGKFLLTRVMYARAYAVNKQDPELYLSLLNEVANASFKDPPEMALPNAVARRDARMLLEKVADYFPGYKGSTDLEPEMQPLEEEDVDLDLD
jgi:hypothetical protein